MRNFAEIVPWIPSLIDLPIGISTQRLLLSLLWAILNLESIIFSVASVADQVMTSNQILSFLAYLSFKS
jgi:hypothetical protein